MEEFPPIPKLIPKVKLTGAQRARQAGLVQVVLPMRLETRILIRAAAILSGRTVQEWAIAILSGAARAAVNGAKTAEPTDEEKSDECP